MALKALAFSISCLIIQSSSCSAFLLPCGPSQPASSLSVLKLKWPYHAQFLSCLSLSSSARSLTETLELHDRFDRWRYLQHLLDEETDPDEANQILYITLDGFLKYPRPKWKGTRETGSAELTQELRRKLELLLDSAIDGRIAAVLPVNEYDERMPEQSALLSRLEILLPDPVEEEEAHKGTWDTIMELHGRESVKINERQRRADWMARCLVTRVLVYYDFLMYGLVDSPFDE